MNRKKLGLLIAAVLLVAVIVVLVLFLTKGQGEEQDSSSSEYSYSIENQADGCLLLLEKNGRTDCEWIPTYEEELPFTVTEQSNAGKAKFLLTTTVPNKNAAISFFLKNIKSGHPVYKLDFFVSIDALGSMNINFDAFTSYGSEMKGGEKTDLPFRTYLNEIGSLCIEITPKKGNVGRWEINVSEDLSAGSLELSDEKSVGFFVRKNENTAATLSFCNEELGAQLVLLIGKTQQNVLYVEEYQVLEYQKSQEEVERLAKEREAFEANYGKLELSESLDYLDYNTDKYWAGETEEDGWESGRINFVYLGNKWSYIVIENATMNDIFPIGNDIYYKHGELSISGKSIALLSESEDSPNLMYAAYEQNNNLYVLTEHDMTEETLTQVLHAMFEQ